MRLIGCKTRFMFLSIVAIVSCFCITVFAEDSPVSNENKGVEQSSTSGKAKLFGGGAEVSYVAPYIYRGIPLTNGPCIQPVLWASLWEFKLGMFMNMYGSNNDRKIKKNQPLLIVFQTGEGSQCFGTINQVKFYLDWKHTFNKYFSLYAAYIHTAYAEHQEYDSLTSKLNTYYEWFDKKSTYGELSIRPSVQLGLFNIFTEQNLVILAFKSQLVIPDDSAGFKTRDVDELRGNYHSAYGVVFEKELVDNFTFTTSLQADIANKRFLNRMVKISKSRNPSDSLMINSQGLYQMTLNLATRYSPRPWFSFSANYAIEVVTNKKVGKWTETKGVRLFGGIHTTFSW
jgi:hypothetical protein